MHDATKPTTTHLQGPNAMIPPTIDQDQASQEHEHTTPNNGTSSHLVVVVAATRFGAVRMVFRRRRRLLDVAAAAVASAASAAAVTKQGACGFAKKTGAAGRGRCSKPHLNGCLGRFHDDGNDDLKAISQGQAIQVNE